MEMVKRRAWRRRATQGACRQEESMERTTIKRRQPIRTCYAITINLRRTVHIMERERIVARYVVLWRTWAICCCCRVMQET